MRLLLLLLLMMPVYADTLVLQSSEAHYIYGSSIARQYAASSKTRLITVRDFSTDVHDNKNVTLDAYIKQVLKYDNLIVLGFDTTFKTNHATVIPLYSNIVKYDVPFKRIMLSFEPKSTIHIICNSYCPTFGEIHIVESTLQLRALIAELNKKENVVIASSLTHIFDNDHSRIVFGESVTSAFRQSKHLCFSLFRPDDAFAATIWIEPADITSGILSVDVDLPKIVELGKVDELYLSASKETVRVK